MDLKNIRKAIQRHRGGLDGASDGQIMLIWNSLDAKTQELYLSSAKTAEPQDTERESDNVTTTDKSESKVRNVSRKRRTPAEE